MEELELDRSPYTLLFNNSDLKKRRMELELNIAFKNKYGVDRCVLFEMNKQLEEMVTDWKIALNPLKVMSSVEQTANGCKFHYLFAKFDNKVFNNTDKCSTMYDLTNVAILVRLPVIIYITRTPNDIATNNVVTRLTGMVRNVAKQFIGDEILRLRSNYDVFY